MSKLVIVIPIELSSEADEVDEGLSSTLLIFSLLILELGALVVAVDNMVETESLVMNEITDIILFEYWEELFYVRFTISSRSREE